MAIADNVSKAKIQDEKKDGISEHCYCCRHCHGNFVGFFLHNVNDAIESKRVYDMGMRFMRAQF